VGPFDWSLALGSCAGPRPECIQPTNLGGLVEAWHTGDARAEESLAHYLSLVLSSLTQETTLHVMADLPRGFNSDAPRPLSSLLHPDGSGVHLLHADLWRCSRALSYTSLDQQGGVDDELLDVRTHVAGRHVLLLDTVYDRPHLVSQCVHELKSRGARWVGFLTLLNAEAAT
jgi:hypothetical protein